MTDDEIVEALKQVSTASLCTELFKLGFRSVYLEGVRPAAPGARMAGPAVTVRFAPAREDVATYERLGDPAYPQRHAIEHVEPGQVLVMDCRGVAGAAAAKLISALDDRSRAIMHGLGVGERTRIVRPEDCHTCRCDVQRTSATEYIEFECMCTLRGCPRK